MFFNSTVKLLRNFFHLQNQVRWVEADGVKSGIRFHPIIYYVTDLKFLNIPLLQTSLKMPRNYIKHSNRLQWSESDMLLAINSVIEGRMGYLRAVDTYNVPKSFLEDRVRKIRGGASKDDVFRKCPSTLKCVFTDELESLLVEHIKTMEARLFGLTKTDLRRLAYQFAERNKLKHKFSHETGLAGVDWVSCFMKRHPELSLRRPELTSAARAMGFNRPVVASFYELLESLYVKYELTPSKIFNMDETGLTSVPKKVGKIISIKGKKQVGTLTSAERGQLVTVALCLSASGHYVPPLMIFPCVRMKNELLDGAPTGTVAVCHPSGWMQQHIFTEWLRHFISYVKPTKESPVLLILDGHATHTKNIDAIELARDNGVHMLCLRPHCTHRLQPLDVGFMGPLSTFYSQAVQTWLRNHPGRVVTQFQIALLFGSAFERAATMHNAVSAFKKTGIAPFNPNTFTDAEFAPSETTEKCEAPIEIMQVEENPSTSTIEPPDNPQSQASIIQEIDMVCEQQGSSSFTGQTQDSDRLNDSRHKTPSPQPSCSKHQDEIVVTPKDIMPIPHTLERNRKPSARRGKTAILTESPYKNELLQNKTKAPQTPSLKGKGRGKKTKAGRNTHN